MEKMPSFEASRPPRFRTIEHTVLEELPNNEKRERVVEHNGSSHRVCIDRISCDDEGNIIFVDQESKEEFGGYDENHD